MTSRLQIRFRPRLDALEDRCSPATLTVAPWSEPDGGQFVHNPWTDPTSGDIVLRITRITEPGLLMAQDHTGGVVTWSLAAAQTAALSSDSAASFQADGRLTSVNFHGNRRLGPVEGTATQIGPFTGSLDARVTRYGAGETATGTLTLTTAAGDSLVLSFEIVRERGTDSLVGTYTVVGGTGRFAAATGTGRMTLSPQPDLTATFTLDGSLTL